MKLKVIKKDVNYLNDKITPKVITKVNKILQEKKTPKIQKENYSKNQQKVSNKFGQINNSRKMTPYVVEKGRPTDKIYSSPERRNITPIAKSSSNRKKNTIPTTTNTAPKANLGVFLIFVIAVYLLSLQIFRTEYELFGLKNNLNKTRHTFPLGNQKLINRIFIRNMKRATERLGPPPGASGGGFWNTLKTATGTPLTPPLNVPYHVPQNRQFASYVGQFTSDYRNYKYTTSPNGKIKHKTIVDENLYTKKDAHHALNTCTTKMDAAKVDSSITELVPIANTLINGQNKQQLLAIKDGIDIIKTDLPTLQILRQTTPEEHQGFRQAYSHEGTPYYRDARADYTVRYYYGTDILEDVLIPRDEEIFAPDRWRFVVNTPKDDEVFTNNISVCEVNRNIYSRNVFNDELQNNAININLNVKNNVPFKDHDKKEVIKPKNNPNPTQIKTNVENIDFNKNEDF